MKRHPIRVVSRRTGTPETTLRAWERRYGVVEPVRADTGRRLYSDEDIERLLLVRRAVDGGRAISDVAVLTTDDLKRLVDEDSKAFYAASVATEDRTEELAILSECIAAVQQMDSRTLTSVLKRASMKLSAVVLIDRIIVPLLTEIGNRWFDGRMTPRHEHLATTVVRLVLQQVQDQVRDEGHRTIVIATPPNQLHDLGSHVAAAVAVTEGWHAVNLGANVPADDVVMAAGETGASAVALSLVYPDDDPITRDAIVAIGDGIEPRTSLIVGGRAAHSYLEAIRSARGVTVETSRTLAVLLNTLAQL